MQPKDFSVTIEEEQLVEKDDNKDLLEEGDYDDDDDLNDESLVGYCVNNLSYSDDNIFQEGAHPQHQDVAKLYPNQFIHVRKSTNLKLRYLTQLWAVIY